ncbi:hypothetical protein LTR28_006196, partial [Elasticomyces elasticus]
LAPIAFEADAAEADFLETAATEATALALAALDADPLAITALEAGTLAEPNALAALAETAAPYADVLAPTAERWEDQAPASLFQPFPLYSALPRTFSPTLSAPALSLDDCEEDPADQLGGAATARPKRRTAAKTVLVSMTKGCGVRDLG